MFPSLWQTDIPAHGCVERDGLEHDEDAKSSDNLLDDNSNSGHLHVAVDMVCYKQK